MNVSWILFKRSVKESSGRLLLTVCAIALGFMLIVSFSAAFNAVSARQNHSVWRGLDQAKIDGVEPMLLQLRPPGNLNKWKNTSIDITSIRSTGDTSPQIPDLPTPHEGEYYVSNALAKLIEDNPSDMIGERFGTANVGVIPDKYTGSPDKLMVIRGMSKAEAENTSTTEVYSYNSNPNPASMDDFVAFILIFGGIVLLFPIITFLVIATQLGSSQREKRYAAMRLIGATIGQVTRIMIFESLMATLAGIIVGTLLYLAAKIPMAQFYFEGERFWPEDIFISPILFVSLSVLTVIGSIAATWWAMRRVRISPLGVSRERRSSKRPKFWTLSPLIIGLLFYIFIATPFGNDWYSKAVVESQITSLLMLAALVFIMVGLILAGPWLTFSISRLFSRRTSSAETLIASKRIATNSKQVFRGVSGVVLALFAGSFYLTVVSGVSGIDMQSIANNGYSVISPDKALVMGSPLPEGFDSILSDTPYVESSAIAYQLEEGHAIRCVDLMEYTDLSCPNDVLGSSYAQVNFDSAPSKDVLIVEGTPVAQSRDYLVDLDGNDSIDKLRALVYQHIDGNSMPAYVISGTYAKLPASMPLISELATLAYLGMGVTLFVAIASLIVSTIAGILERRRSLMTLRLSGMTLNQMRRMVMVESLIPLVTVSLVASSIGVWVGVLFIDVLSSSVKPSLSWMYVAIVLGSLAAAVATIYATLPLIDRMTRFENNRTE